MMTDVYQKLAGHLDNLPGGFPPTESGVELRILRRLFTPEEAELAVHVSLIPEEAGVISRRARIGRAEAEQRLAGMARKGLIIGLCPEAKPALYMAAQFVIGIWEFHVNSLDPELVREFNEYLPVLFREAWKFPQLRTIPVNRSLDHQLTILPYERAEELVRRASKIVVAPCICRRERGMAGEGCSKLGEACLVFGLGADLYQRNGLGRPIGREEALDILARADEAGLVLQPGNAQEPTNICCCCGCCCGVLGSLKTYPRPAELVSSPFRAVARSESCIGCGACTTRCQMGALQLESERVALNSDRCIGCGLCVSTCPTDSLTLARKPVSEQPRVPKDGIRSLIQLGKTRGKLGGADLAWMMVKSKMERLLASR
ncbi:MAG: 4Fe-4S binding protein [Acidobacteriia bacterium]|nr:4Fe-4S binding protein [Terriglobia bacterium]